MWGITRHMQRKSDAVSLSVWEYKEQLKGQFNWTELWQVTITTPPSQIGEGSGGFRTQPVIALIWLWLWLCEHWLWPSLFIPNLMPGNLFILVHPSRPSTKEDPNKYRSSKLKWKGFEEEGREEGQGKRKLKWAADPVSSRQLKDTSFLKL